MRCGAILACAAAAMAASACDSGSSPAGMAGGGEVSDQGTPVVPAQQAVTSAYLPSTDLETMNAAEFSKIVPPGPHCSFSYTSSGNPVLIASPSAGGASVGAIKLHGRLVEVRTSADSLQALAGGTVFQADGIAVGVQPDDAPDVTGSSPVNANLLLRLRQGLRAGYGGHYRCAPDGYPATH